MESFDIKELITQILTEFLNRDDYPNLEIELMNGEPILVYANKNKISQVITNLSNARESTIRGIISVEVKKENKNVIVSVKDNGRGITQEIFLKLFNKSASRSEFGTGLGLYISKKIIDAHSCTI